MNIGILKAGPAIEPDALRVVCAIWQTFVSESLYSRGEPPLGNPFSGILHVAFDTDNPAPAGLLVMDEERSAIEIVYVMPEYRRAGVASLLISAVWREFPSLTVKGPLSSDGRALAARYRLDMYPIGDRYQIEIDAELEEYAKVKPILQKKCRSHFPRGRGGMCRPCSDRMAQSIVQAFVNTYVSVQPR
jgi:GNAT superfamily N-acetyltransferase